MLRALNAWTNLKCPWHCTVCDVPCKCELLSSLFCHITCRFLQECFQMKKFHLYFCLNYRSKDTLCPNLGQLRRAIKKKNHLPPVILRPRGSNNSQCWVHSTSPLLPPSTTTAPLDTEENTRYFYKETWIRQSNWLESRKPDFHSLYLPCHLGDPGHFTSSLCSLPLHWTSAKQVQQELHSALLTTMLRHLH